MKIKTLTFLGTFLLSSICVNAQKPKLKSEKISFLGTELNYKITPEALKSGPIFLTDSKTQNILVKGFYKNNEPSGTWYFYNHNGLETSYNYDNKKILFIDTAVIVKNIVSIISSDKDLLEKASVPILLYPKDLFVKTIID